MFKRSLLTVSALLFALVLFQYFNTGYSNGVESKDSFEIIAHRGVHQHYLQGEGKDLRKSKDRHELIYGCETEKNIKPTHNYIENTIESIQAAFDYGATIVEIDIRPTLDNRLVVFHDGTLECKTNGKGKTSDFTAQDLELLDVGYRYTSDNGNTFPLRGKGIAGIKTLDNILSHFPTGKFLIDNKSGNDLEVAQLIVDVLSRLPEQRQKQIFLWAQDEAYRYIRERLPSAKRLLLPRGGQKKFYKAYILTLGLNGVPEEYRGEGLGMTKKYTKYIWGWPYNYLKKIKDAETKFYIYANSQKEFDDFYNLPVNGIVTVYIENISVPHR